MRWICLIFSFCLPLASQVAPDSWTQPIVTLITSGNLAQARQRQAAIGRAAREDTFTGGNTGRLDVIIDGITECDNHARAF